MRKYTEGPWILSEYEVRHPITHELRKGCEIFCKDNNRVVCEIPDYHFHAEDVEYQSADARLLTSSPDLLEALEGMVSLFPTGVEDEGSGIGFNENLKSKYRAAIKAIEKSRGQL